MSLAETDIPADDPHVLAERALALAAEHATPPTPTAYRIWYVYAAGLERELNLEIDGLLEGGAPLDDETLERLERAHLADAGYQQEVAKIGVEIDGHADALGGQLADGIAHGATFQSELTGVVAGMRREGDASQTLERALTLNVTHLQQLELFQGELQKSQSEIKALARTIAALNEQANRDELTGLTNRRHFQSTLEVRIARAAAEGESLAIAIADIDGFSAINETYGRGMGDEVLKKFAQLAQKSVRATDTVGRLSGQQFGLIFPGASLRGGHVIANRIRQYFMALRFLDPRRNRRLERVTVSFGATGLRASPEAFGEDGPTADSVDEMLGRAAGYLRVAKAAGRNKVHSGA